MSDEPLVLTGTEAAKALHLDEPQFAELVKAGTVPVVHLVDGGPDLFRPSDLRAVVFMAGEAGS